MICLSISAKKWPNWNSGVRPDANSLIFSIHFCEEVAQLKHFWCRCYYCQNGSLSISAKKWPNWNIISHMAISAVFASLSISAKKWPNWNINMAKKARHAVPIYPFLRRSGPIETCNSAHSNNRTASAIHFCEEVAQLKSTFYSLRIGNAADLSISAKKWPLPACRIRC